MFDNLLYIFSKENEIINNYITDTESIREVKKLKQELIKKNAEIKLLQRRYNKLLNNCIQIELNKKIQSATYVINKNLKQISIDCEIGMKISTHIARHSFSDNIRQSGENIYNISKILGHSDIAVTQKYLKSLDQNSVDESLNKFYNQ